jgi:hypothetical protein
MLRRRVSAVGAIVAALLLVPAALAATPLERFIAQAGEAPGFVPRGRPQVFRTASAWTGVLPTRKPKRDAGRLRREGFVLGVFQRLTDAHDPAIRRGSSAVIELGSASAARAEGRVDMREGIAAEPGATINRYTIRGVPGSFGYTATLAGRGASNAFFTEGRCLLTVGDSEPVGNVAAPVMAAVRAVFRRTDGSHPSPCATKANPVPTGTGTTTGTSSTTSTTTPSPPRSQPVGDPLGKTWTLTFDDEFNGTSIDTSKWVALTGWKNNNVTSNPKNCTENGGYLILALPGDGTGCDLYSSKTYGAGANAASLDVGDYVEARIYFPGPGTAPTSELDNWPAFWAYDGSGNWLAGENDIAEALGHIEANYHSSSAGFNVATPPGNWGNSWHVYGIHRSATQVQIFYDGTLIATASTSDDGGPEPIMFTSGKSNSCCGAPAVFGPAANVLVDWVRAWK